MTAPRRAATRTGLAGLLLACGIAQGALVVVPDGTRVAAGGAISVTLFVPNDSADGELDVDLPPRLTLRTRGVAAAPDIVLKPAPSQPMHAKLKPGGFLRVRYSGIVPRGLVGNLVLEPVDFDGPTIGLSSSESGEVRATAGTSDAPADGKDQTAEQVMGPSDRDTARFMTAFSPYEPNYFSAGSDGVTNAKFQVSLKFRLFNPDTRTPFLEKLYLGYSQTSIWAIGSSSAPFYDSSYRPSLFFLDEDVAQWPWRKTSRLGFQAGLEHESNGKDGAASRSINIAFIRPTYTLPIADDYFFSVSPKIYAYLEKDDNPDMPSYRGYADLLLKIGATEGIQLATTLRKGTASAPYSAEFDLSIPLSTPMLGNLGGYLHLQYFQGWGESLLDYNRKVHPQIRLGLMITR